MEHLKTTLIALNQQVTVVNDLKKDVNSHKAMLQKSEHERDELHIHIKNTSIKIQQDTSTHNSFQTDLINENQALKDEIARLKAEFNQKYADLSKEKYEQTKKLEAEKEEQRIRSEKQISEMDIRLKSKIVGFLYNFRTIAGIVRVKQ